MRGLSAVLQSDRTSYYSGVFLASVWGIFAYAHILAFLHNGDISLLMFCLSETLTAGFYLIRSAPRTVSILPIDWLVAIGGTIAPLFLRPAPWGVMPSKSKHVPRRVGRQVNKVMCSGLACLALL